MSLLGLSVSLIGQIGNDEQGKMVLEGLKDKGVDTTHFNVSTDFRTGCAVIYVDTEGNNMLVHAPGANHSISLQTIDNARETITSASMYVSQNEINLDALIYGLNIAHTAKVPTLLNPAPAIALPDEIFPLLDYIAPNETESEIYTKINKKGLSEENWRRATAAWFHEKGVKNVCITLGANGAYFSDGEKEYYVPAYHISPLDTTAAGDSFIGGFVYGVVNRWENDKTLLFANACGALSSTIKGAQNSIQDLERVRSFMLEHGVDFYLERR
jgi:ribokinase